MKNEGLARVMSVTGPIDARELGPTLAHEHLYADLSIHSGRPDNVMTDVDAAIAEMAPFLAAGGRSIVEVTPADVGRDASKLREISEATGVRIVSGIGLYARGSLPDWVYAADAQAIGDFFVREIEEGTDGVRAGVIGELFSRNGEGEPPEACRLDDLETKIFEGAAIASKRTGCGIVTHALGRTGYSQLDVIERAGADPGRVAIGHSDAVLDRDPAVDFDYWTTILDRGAFCEFDLVGWTDFAPDEARAERLAELVGRGYAGRMLLSTDTCRRSQLHAAGGRGYDYLWTSFLPRLRALGVGEAEIDSMLVSAPRDFLTGG